MKKTKVIYLVFFMILTLILTESAKSQWSENVLLQRRIFKNPDVWHLTKAYANSEWGVDLYAYPTSVSMVYNVDSINGEVYSAMSFTSDYAFHRIVYSEAYQDWIRAYGSFGSSIGHFNSPSGIVAFNRPEGDWQSHHIYVADTWNNRICGFTYNWSSQTINSPYEITGGGLVFPKDLDINNGGEFGDSSNDRLWVANGDNTIKKFDLNGNLLLTFGSFDDLRGIACGRSYFTDTTPPYERFANNNYIYVLEGRYIRKYYENPPGNIQYERSVLLGPQCDPPCPWPERMTSIDVDNVGQVWTTVVDTKNETSRIDKYTPDLDFLCQFNAGGIFHRLQCFSHSGGKLGGGNVIVLEEWDNESGGLYFWFATDILNYTIGSNPEHLWHYASYTLVDPALISVKVYNETGGLIRTVKDTIPHILDFSGYKAYWWDGYDSFGLIAPSGNYRIEVTAYSAYLHGSTGAHCNTVIKNGWVYHINYNQSLLVPTITSVQAVDTSMCIKWDDNNSNELGYIIERRDATSGQWIVIDTTTWDVESYTDPYQVMGSETYDYRIKAYNYFGCSGYSNIKSKRAHPRPPMNLFVQNFYCNRPHIIFGKVASQEGGVPTFKPKGEFDCYPPFPDSIPSDASVIYADYPTHQKPGTFAGMQVWSKSCNWYNHNFVKRETTFVQLHPQMPVQTKPDTIYCTGDWTYYFKVRTVDIYGDTSIFVPDIWGWPYACCVGPCHIQVSPYPSVAKIDVPEVFALEQNHPNPFNPETEIKYALPQTTRVKLAIYNVLGQKVRTLVDEDQTAGFRTISWDGKNGNGDEVASGIYFYRLQAEKHDEVRKMILLK